MLSRIKYLIICLLFIFVNQGYAQEAVKSLEVGGYPELRRYEMPFTGPWEPADDPLRLSKFAFADIKNMRYTDKGIKGVSGYSKINTTALTGYLKGRNAFHFTKDDPSESHVLIQAYNTGLTASQLLQNTTSIPSQGDFSGTALHTDASGASVGRFASASQGRMIYCNGKESMVWGGDEVNCSAFLTASDIALGAIDDVKDYTSQVSNTSEDADEIAQIGGGADSYTKLLLHCNGTDGATSFPNTVVYGGGTITATTIAFVDSNPDTITDSDNNFSNAGMAIGSITVSGSGAGNDGTYTVVTQSDSTLTLTGGDTLTAEAAGPSITITMHAVTVGGNAQVDTAQAKFGTGSALSDGSGDYLSVPDSSHWYMGTGRFTADMWVRFDTVPVNPTSKSFMYQYVDANNYVRFYYLNNQLIFLIKSGGSTTVSMYVSWTPVTDRWYHLALIRGWGGNINDWCVAIDGGAGDVETDSDPWPDLAAPLRFGYQDGWTDEIRVVHGKAIWIQNFSPPTSAYSEANMYFLVGSTEILQGIKLYLANANQTSAIVVGNEWNGNSWSSIGVTDNTSGLSVDGTITWTSTECKKRHLEGRSLYWYYFLLSAGQADIYRCTAEIDFQPVKNVWSGEYSTVAACKVHTGTGANEIYLDYTLEVNDYSIATVAILDSLDTTEDLLLGFVNRQQAFEIKMPTDKINSGAASLLTISYHDGNDWQAVDNLVDGTRQGGVGSSVTFRKTGTITFTPPENGEEFPKIINEEGPYYWYRFRVAVQMDVEVEVYYIAGIENPEKIDAYQFPLYYQNRTLLCSSDEYPSSVLISSENSPAVYNGTDSTTLYFGGNNQLTAGVSFFNRFGSSIYNFALFCKKSETWLLSGYSPDTFSKYQVSTNIGCPAPLTMKTCEVGYEIAPELTRNIAMWLAYNGVVIFDGGLLKLLKGMEPYFDPNDAKCINYDYIDKSWAFFDSLRSEYNLFIPSGSGQTTCNVWLIYDVMRNKWTKKVPPAYPQAGCSVHDTDGAEYSYLCFDDGYMRLNEDGNTFDGTAIAQEVVLRDMLLTESMWDEVRVDFLNLLVEAKTGTQNSIAIHHRADGNTSWTALTSVPMYKTGYRYNDHVQRVNKLGNSHQFKFGVTTNDKVDGFEPIGLGLLFHTERTKTTAD